MNVDKLIDRHRKHFFEHSSFSSRKQGCLPLKTLRNLALIRVYLDDFLVDSIETSQGTVYDIVLKSPDIDHLEKCKVCIDLHEVFYEVLLEGKMEDLNTEGLQPHEMKYLKKTIYKAKSQAKTIVSEIESTDKTGRRKDTKSPKAAPKPNSNVSSTLFDEGSYGFRSSFWDSILKRIPIVSSSKKRVRIYIQLYIDDL